MLNKKRLPFKDSSTLFLMWMSMLMVFIASLILFAGVALFNIADSWKKDLSGSLTVQIPTYLLDGTPRQEVADDIAKTSQLLSSSAGVVDFKVLDDEDIRELMSPWLGHFEKIDDLPIPRLIDVTLSMEDEFDFESFKSQLSEQVPMAVSDSHRIWLANLIKTVSGVKNVMICILLLLALTTSFIVVYSTRSCFESQVDVLKILHVMGAKDSVIAFQFSLRNFVKAFVGGIVGFVLTLPIVYLVVHLSNAEEYTLLSYAKLSAPQWWTIVSLPLIAGILAFGTALVTALKKLKSDF